MALLMRVYYNAVFGGLGGLLAWVLVGVFIDARSEGVGAWLLRGAVVGSSIGYLVVSVEAIRDRSLVRFSRLASYGILLGALGGSLGALVGEGVLRLFNEMFGVSVGGAILARGSGWLFLGMAVGGSEGIAARSMGKFSYGTIGGTIGGFVGGALFALCYELGRMGADAGQPVAPLPGALGLVILGACIGSLSALVTGVFQPASVKVIRGWQEGREYALAKQQNRLGRDEHADIALFRDMRVEKWHAVIHRRGNRYFLVNDNAPADFTRVNDVPVTDSRELHEGDRIQLGQVVLRFQLREARNRKPVRSGA